MPDRLGLDGASGMPLASCSCRVWCCQNGGSFHDPLPRESHLTQPRRSWILQHPLVALAVVSTSFMTHSSSHILSILLTSTTLLTPISPLKSYALYKYLRFRPKPVIHELITREWNTSQKCSDSSFSYTTRYVVCKIMYICMYICVYINICKCISGDIVAGD